MEPVRLGSEFGRRFRARPPEPGIIRLKRSPLRLLFMWLDERVPVIPELVDYDAEDGKIPQNQNEVFVVLQEA